MQPTLSEEEARQLLHILCIKLGFCLEPKMQSRLAKNPPVTIEKFASAVYKAEGLDPDLRSELYGQVQEYVAAAFKRHLDQKHSS